MNFAKYVGGLKWLELVFTAGAAVGVVVGIVGGLGAGFMIGTLTAPQEGKRTRKDISDKIENIIAEAKSKGEEFSQSLNSATTTEDRETTSATNV